MWQILYQLDHISLSLKLYLLKACFHHIQVFFFPKPENYFSCQFGVKILFYTLEILVKPLGLEHGDLGLSAGSVAF